VRCDGGWARRSEDTEQSQPAQFGSARLGRGTRAKPLSSSHGINGQGFPAEVFLFAPHSPAILEAAFANRHTPHPQAPARRAQTRIVILVSINDNKHGSRDMESTLSHALHPAFVSSDAQYTTYNSHALTSASTSANGAHHRHEEEEEEEEDDDEEVVEDALDESRQLASSTGSAVPAAASSR
jgi:hypothetical protein